MRKSSYPAQNQQTRRRNKILHNLHNTPRLSKDSMMIPHGIIL